MNVFHYKNCILMNIFNCLLPEVDGHFKVIYNLATKKFKAWKFANFGGLTYYRECPLREIEQTEAVIETVNKNVTQRLRMLANRFRPSGSHDTIGHIEGCYKDCIKGFSWGMLEFYLRDFFFIYDNYVGDVGEEAIEFPDQLELEHKRFIRNLNPKIKRTVYSAMVLLR